MSHVLRKVALVVLVPLLFLLVLLSAICGSVSTSAASTGYGSLAEVALAEYASGEADGSYHAGGMKYKDAMGLGSSLPWCACFVSWCCDQVGMGQLKSFAAADWVGSLVDRNPDVMTRTKNDGAHAPAVGDVCVWRPAGAEYDVHGGGMSHVGIVVEVDDSSKTFKTVEGNSSNAVHKRSYSYGSPTSGCPDWFVSIQGVGGEGASGERIEIVDYDKKGTFVQGVCADDGRRWAYVIKQNVQRKVNLQRVSLSTGRSERLGLGSAERSAIHHGNGMTYVRSGQTEYLVVAPGKGNKYLAVLAIHGKTAVLVGKAKTKAACSAVTATEVSGGKARLLVCAGKGKSMRWADLDLSTLKVFEHGKVTGFKGTQGIAWSTSLGHQYVYGAHGNCSTTRQSHVTKFELKGTKLKKVWDKAIDGEAEGVIPANGTIWVATEGKTDYNKSHKLDSRDWLTPWTPDGTPAGEGSVADGASTNLGQGQTLAVPGSVPQSGVTKDFTSYEFYYNSGRPLKWHSGTNQKRVEDLWKQKGSKYTGGIATIDGRVLVAMTSKFGKVGDYVDVKLSNGKVIRGVLADEKRSSGDNGTATPWGHKKGGGKISLVEFEVNRSDCKSGKVTAWKPWLGAKVVSVTNYGSALK